MSQIVIDIHSRKPIYEQIVECVKKLAFSGEMRPDEPMPSIRSLASELAINPNTIQKSYDILETENIIYSLPARGSYISPNITDAKAFKREQTEKHLVSVLNELYELGYDKNEVLKKAEMIWRDTNDKN